MIIVQNKPAQVKAIKARLQQQYQAEFNAGRDAFHRKEFPRPDWSKAKHAGWDFAGECAYLASCENDSIGIEETFSPWR